jgi:citrate/tricarballylate utilization protein
MERLPIVGEGDLTYLANLCHDCRACYQACMYAAPHPFAVQIPTLMSEARERSYAEFARPRWFARAFTAGPKAVAALTVVGAVLFALLATIAGNGAAVFAPDESAESFFDVLPYSLMLVPSLVLTLFVVAVIAWGFADFHRASRGVADLGPRTWLTGAREAATLRWMRGGGDDCYYPDVERPSALRRWFHHLTAYGFLAALVSTSLAALYHNVLGEESPYPVLHPVVLTGLVGGIGMTVGTTGLLWLKTRAAPLQSRREALLNSSFLLSLNAASTSGLLLLALRETAAIGPLLVLHLGTIVALYVTAPYGKFVHIVYRTAAVIRSAAERAAEDARERIPTSAPGALRAPRLDEASLTEEAAQVETGAG